MLNENLTQKQALWLLNEYVPRRGGRISGITMDKYFIPARSLMLGKEIARPGCGCHFKQFVLMTNSLYNQHEDEIKLIANPPKTKKSAKK
jgi:hypothetical protein